MEIKLGLKNFGPVVKGDIVVKPMTVFIGPNASGKSYTAMALYAFVNGLLRSGIWPELICARYSLAKKPWDEYLNELERGGAIALEAEFKRIFGLPLEQLTTKGSESGELTLILKRNKKEVKYVLKWPKTSLKIEGLRCAKRTNSRRIAAIISRHIVVMTMRAQSVKIIYLPASRSGLVQTYGFYVDLVLSVAEELPLTGAKISALPGIVGDFLRWLLIPETGEAPFYPLFRERLGIDVERKERSLVVRYGEFEMDARSAPSGVAELAPLGLLLRHGFVRKGDVVIIEEPEAHLHPEMQIKAVNLLADLAARGVKFIVTTHSDLVLNRLSNIVMEAELNGGGLPRRKVAVYLFKPQGNGYIVERLKIGEEGIPDDEFLRVHEALYKEYINLIYEAKARKAGELHSQAT